jgi:hypothetical protein
MSAPEKLNQMFRQPQLTRTRMLLAFAVAVVADGLQFIFTLVPFVDQAVDVAAFGLTTWAIGFHLLLLPTFAVEFIPGVDMLPTWTACVIAVIALRKREQNTTPPTPPQPKD